MKAMNSPVFAPDEALEELELCISCLQSNAPGTNFCRHCGTPLTSYAATAPMASIFAEGDFWRKAVSQAKGHTLTRVVILLFLTFMVFTILAGMITPR